VSTNVSRGQSVVGVDLPIPLFVAHTHHANVLLNILYRAALIWTTLAAKRSQRRRRSQAAKLYRGASPSNDGTELSTAVMPEGFAMTSRQHDAKNSPLDLDKEVLELIKVTADVRRRNVTVIDTSVRDTVPSRHSGADYPFLM
jgi:hypothetical protein